MFIVCAVCAGAEGTKRIFDPIRGIVCVIRIMSVSCGKKTWKNRFYSHHVVCFIGIEMYIKPLANVRILSNDPACLLNQDMLQSIMNVTRSGYLVQYSKICPVRHIHIFHSSCNVRRFYQSVFRHRLKFKNVSLPLSECYCASFLCTENQESSTSDQDQLM